MLRRDLLKKLALATPAACLPGLAAGYAAPAGPFQPSWESLAQYEVPAWFRDAKFGLWAHWGPQCQPEYGDWYARQLYEEGSDKYHYHLRRYGHPSRVGFKDVIHEWRAESWDPDELLGFYQRAGAKYFVALANHHDNLDLYQSSHHRWNSTRVGPKKDLVGGWARAARRHGLRFGVSVHAAHAWQFYEPAQRADQHGPLAGVPYDGRLAAAAGQGQWWQGYDPQELYAQRHAAGDQGDSGAISRQWDWGNGAVVPSAAYCEQFYRRTRELLDRYQPDLVYYDDTALPLWPISDVGLRLAAHQYNASVRRHGRNEAVATGKGLSESQRQCLVWDIERGQSSRIEPLPWQTCTCLGDWHYDRRLYERHGYKSAATVVHTLADVVSKNGNLLLSVPVRGNGTIDEQERGIVQEVGAWLALNGESVYGTRPWTACGEGPALAGSTPPGTPGLSEGQRKAFTAQDIRYATSGEALYATALGQPPDGQLHLRLLAEGSPQRPQPVRRVELLARPGQALAFERTAQGLHVQLPAALPPTLAPVLRITG